MEDSSPQELKVSMASKEQEMAGMRKQLSSLHRAEEEVALAFTLV